MGYVAYQCPKEPGTLPMILPGQVTKERWQEGLWAEGRSADCPACGETHPLSGLAKWSETPTIYLVPNGEAMIADGVHGPRVDVLASDSTGEPASRLRLVWTISGDAIASPSSMRTNADGRARTYIVPNRPGEGVRVRLHCVSPETGAEAEIDVQVEHRRS